MNGTLRKLVLPGVLVAGTAGAMTLADVAREADGAGRTDAGAGAALHAEPVVVHALDVHCG